MTAMSTPAPHSHRWERLTATGRRGLLSDAARVRTLMLRGGAVLLPLGLLVIGLGWYGTANTPYEYDQISYVVSGGLLGLGLVLVGGFLFFGAWLAQIAQQGRESSERLTEALLALAVAQGTATAAATEPVQLVTAGKGTTLHRSDCGLVAKRDDLVPVGTDTEGLSPCRVCAPLA
ncbi:MAG: hypothetical protein ABR549_20230 [Mycobacteriales bacterium]